MKITIESTTKIVELQHAGGAVLARIWEGETDSGIKIHCYITYVVVREDEDRTQFDAELRQCREPSPAIRAIPLSMII